MSRQLFEEARKVLTQEAAVKLDPVGQEDKDIDNDGDADKTDSYLKKRRGAISAAIAKSKNESSLSDDDVERLKSILGEQGVAEGLEELGQIKYWQQDTMESGRWVKTKPMSRATAEKVVDSFPRGEIVDVEQDVAEETEHVEEAAYTGKNPHHIKSVSSAGAGKIVAITNAGARHVISAKDTGGKMPRVGEPISNYVKVQEEVEQIDEISQELKGRVQDARRGQSVEKSLGYSPRPRGYEAPPISTATKNRLLKRVGGKGNELYAKNVMASHLDKRSRGDLKAAESYEGQEGEQIDEQGRVVTGRRYGNQNLNAPATGRIAADNARTAPQATVTTTTLTPGHSDTAARLLAVQAPGLPGNRRVKLLDRKPKSESFEMIENMSYSVPDNPSYQDYIKAALSIAECKSFSELSEEDQQYIIQEMEDAFRSNDIDFILEANAVVDMKADIAFLESKDYVVEGCYDDDQIYYVYEDKDTGVIRKVFYEGTQKITQVLEADDVSSWADGFNERMRKKYGAEWPGLKVRPKNPVKPVAPHASPEAALRQLTQNTPLPRKV